MIDLFKRMNICKDQMLQNEELQLLKGGTVTCGTLSHFIDLCMASGGVSSRALCEELVTFTCYQENGQWCCDIY